jgi:CDP-diacylglycerol--glycerol-3-phosphate 3-phosphatidyltransferase
METTGDNVNLRQVAPLNTRFKYASTAIWTPANLLTLARLIVSVPFLFWMYYEQSGWLLWSAFFILSTSDIVDGYIARRVGPTTFGAFFDPLADKVLAMGAFFVLGWRNYYAWLPIAIMAAREVAVSIARSILSKYRISLPARKLGKAKTFAQLCAIGFTLWPPVDQYHTFHNNVLWLAVVLSVVSGIDLFVHAQREVQEKNIHLGDPFPS